MVKWSIVFGAVAVHMLKQKNRCFPQKSPIADRTIPQATVLGVDGHHGIFGADIQPRMPIFFVQRPFGSRRLLIRQHGRLHVEKVVRMHRRAA